MVFGQPHGDSESGQYIYDARGPPERPKSTNIGASWQESGLLDFAAGALQAASHKGLTLFHSVGGGICGRRSSYRRSTDALTR